MPNPTFEAALIVGAGRGLSASLARLFTTEGLRVALAARDAEKLAPLCAETGAKAFACDAVDPDQVARLFSAVEAAIGAPDVVVYNASARPRSGCRTGSCRGRAGDYGQCVRRLPRRARGRIPHGAQGARGDFVHRGFR